jgi:hypothetical protein
MPPKEKEFSGDGYEIGGVCWIFEFRFGTYGLKVEFGRSSSYQVAEARTVEPLNR